MNDDSSQPFRTTESAADSQLDPLEQEFLAQYDASAFPHPSVAVDVALVTIVEGALQVLLTRRTEYPQKGRFALPGGFVKPDESLDEAAARVMRDKGGVSDVYLEQLYTFGRPDRDPRTRVISVSYYALIDHATLMAAHDGNDDMVLAGLMVDWQGESGGLAKVMVDHEELPLAFDHDEMLGMVMRRLRGKLDYVPLGFELLPEQFTLRDLQAVHEAVHGRQLNKDSFRRRMLAAGCLHSTGEREQDVPYRPAELFRFIPTSSQQED